MNQELSKISGFFKNNFSDYIDSFIELSFNSYNNTSFVNSNEQAYNFDEIVKKYFDDPPYSVDALYLNDKIYLIEFKDSSIEEANDKLRQILKVKLCSSLLFLENYISNECLCDINQVKIHYLIVVNSMKNPKLATSTALMNISKISSNYLLAYQKKLNGRRVFCDKCIICNELNFLDYLNK